MPTLSFHVDGNHFLKNGPFQTRLDQENHVISLAEISSNKNIKRPVIVAFLSSSGVVWTVGRA